MSHLASPLFMRASRDLFPVPLDFVERFRRDGYIVIDSPFSEDTLNELNEVICASVSTRGNLSLPPDIEQNDPRLEIQVHEPSRDGVQRRVFKSSKSHQRLQKLYTNYKKFQGMRDPEHVFRSDDGVLTDEKISTQYEEYLKSDQFMHSARKKSRFDDVAGFYDRMANNWYHLWYQDHQLERLYRESVYGRQIGRLAAEFGGFLCTRLYQDQVTQKIPWGNGQALHCSSPYLDFVDSRAVQATVLLPGSSLTAESGGGHYVLPGSHHVISQISSNGIDMSLFQSMPSAWDTGEWARTVKELGDIEPVIVDLKPGQLLMNSSSLVYGMFQNLGPEQPMMHTSYLMPDGAVYSGARLSWMSQSVKGPLHLHEAGEVLRDDALFPVLYSALDDG